MTITEGDELLTVEIKETTKNFTSYMPAQQVGSQPASAQQASGNQRAPTRTLSLNLQGDEVTNNFQRRRRDRQIRLNIE